MCRFKIRNKKNYPQRDAAKMFLLAPLWLSMSLIFSILKKCCLAAVIVSCLSWIIVMSCFIR